MLDICQAIEVDTDAEILNADTGTSTTDSDYNLRYNLHKLMLLQQRYLALVIGVKKDL